MISAAIIIDMAYERNQVTGEVICDGCGYDLRQVGPNEWIHETPTRLTCSKPRPAEETNPEMHTKYREATSTEIAACLRRQVIECLEAADAVYSRPSDLRRAIRDAILSGRSIAEWLEAQGDPR